MSISQVNGQERARAAAAVAALRSSGAYAAGGVTAPTRQPDSVNLSEEARSLSAAHKAVASAPEVREDRVAAIKAAIANGTYSVDSRKLAHAMAERLGAAASRSI
ncbi:MAG TPA: flagellar biosynthesis anti-sigma factor FlgM [Reyranella sp.]|nr:flagellar biosynthesis anti-sigma factor FlgM [Reyranella sp.]